MSDRGTRGREGGGEENGRCLRLNRARIDDE